MNTGFLDLQFSSDSECSSLNLWTVLKPANANSQALLDKRFEDSICHGAFSKRRIRRNNLFQTKGVEDSIP